MKIAIILSGNIAKAPYIYYYTNFFKNHRIDFDIISWNRLALDNEKSSMSLNIKESEGKGYLKRLILYLKYRRHIIKILKTEKYDKIVVATVAIGVVLRSYLKKHFAQRFIFDIRDYSITCKLFSNSFKSLVKESEATIISSVGYKNWLPKQGNYFISHNFPFQYNKNIEQADQIPLKIQSKIITLTAIGTLRDINANQLIINSLGNDPGFDLNYIGSGPAYEPLRKYVSLNKISNALFYGFYKKEDEVSLLRNTNLINNFTNDDLNSRTLTTNRFYLSVVLGIPMIVRHGTYQAQLCQLYNIGCIIKPGSDIKNQLLSYINSFDKEEYNKGRADFLSVVEEDTKKLEAFLTEFIRPI